MITEHFVCFTTDFFLMKILIFAFSFLPLVQWCLKFSGYSVILQNCPPSEGKAPCGKFYEKR